MKKLALVLFSTIFMTTTSFARDQIQIVGSSTVFPFATTIPETFGQASKFKSPVIESTGSGGGMKMFCKGIGTDTPDITNSSRAIKKTEAELCAKNGVTPIERLLGYDGITFSMRHENKGFEDLTPLQIYQALKAGSTAKTWSDVDPSLPNVAIKAFIPGTKHGTREVFETKVMLAGCKAAGEYDKSLGKKPAEKACFKVRTDGASVDIDGDYTETLASLDANVNGVGVFGLSFLLNNTDSIYAAKINGVMPSTESIASGEYPVSRPLQFYVKHAHLDQVPGLKEYIEFFVSDEIAGPDGPLAEYGLVSDPELAATQDMVAKF